MYVAYTDETDSPRTPQAYPPPQQNYWVDLEEDSGSISYEYDPQDDLLANLQDHMQGRLQAHSQDISQQQPQECPQSTTQDHLQQMLEVQSYRWDCLRCFESAVADPKVCVCAYDNDDEVQWWHIFVNGNRRGRWDGV